MEIFSNVNQFSNAINMMCRACLCNENKTQFMFLNNLDIKFKSCTNLEVTRDDGLPSSLCLKCVEQLDICYKFVTLCLRSDQTLRSNNELLLVKDEPVHNDKDKSPSPELLKEEYSDRNTSCEYDSTAKKQGLRKTRQSIKKINRSKILTTKHPLKTKSERYPLKCSKCPSFFKSQERYDGHLRTHEGKKPAVCKMCGKSYNKWHGLLQHMVVHTGEKKFMCHCGKDFFYRGAYKVHIKTHGGDEVKTFVCDECGKGFRTNAELKHHKFSHTDKTPLQCPQCPKRFKNNNCLRAHIQRHAQIKNHICSTCGKATITPAELRIHMRTHTDHKPFACNLCEKKFRVRSGLRSHMLSHTGVRNYKCGVCEKLFMTSTSLKTHQLVHSGEKPFRCGICDRLFSQRSSLKTHMKVHSKESISVDNKVEIF